MTDLGEEPKGLISLARLILESLTDAVSEGEEIEVKGAYFAEGCDGMTREILSEVADWTDEDRSIRVFSLVALVVLRMVYPQYSSVFLRLKTRIACSLYRFFWTDDKSAGKELAEISRTVLQIAREDDDFLVGMKEELSVLLQGATDRISSIVGPLVEELLALLMPVDNSLVAQLSRLSSDETHDVREKVHGILWSRIKRQVDEGDQNPRLIVYVPPEYRLLGVADFVRRMVFESLGSLTPLDVKALEEIPEGGIPALFLGCVGGNDQPTFRRGYIQSYDCDRDLMGYSIRSSKVKVAVGEASRKAVFPYIGQPFELPKRGQDGLRMALRENVDAYAYTVLTRPVVVIGCNEDEARQILALIRQERVTALYVTGAGGIHYLQNDEIAPRQALVFLPKASVLVSIFEKQNEAQWRSVAELLGWNAMTEFDSVLVDVDENDKHVYELDCNARVAVSIDSIAALCDLSRYSETLSRIKNESSEVFAWTPDLCAELRVEPERANVIVDVPYSSREEGPTIRSMGSIASRHSVSSGPAWGGVVRRTLFGLHEPILSGVDNDLDRLRRYAEDRGIPNVDMSEVAEDVSRVRRAVGESAMPGLCDWATEKYRVIKERAEALDPSDRIDLVNPHASDSDDAFIKRMTNLSRKHRVFTPQKYAQAGCRTWYTVARPGKREILEFVYPIASEATWFVYPLERQFLGHMRKVCHRFLARLFPISTLTAMLGVKGFDRAAFDGVPETIQTEVVTKKNRLDALQRYFGKMRLWDDWSEGGSNAPLQVAVGWKITLDSGSVIWATDDYESLVENSDGSRAFVRPKFLAEGTIVWELQPPKEMALLSEEGIRQIVEKNACPLYFGWKQLMDEYRERNRLTKRDLYERLKSRGLKVGYCALLNWLSDGNVMCPNGGERTLTLIADELGSAELRRQARGIAIVARIVRVMNQTTARDIYDALRRAFAKGLSSCEVDGVGVDLDQQGLFVSGRVATVVPLDGVSKPGYLVNRVMESERSA